MLTNQRQACDTVCSLKTAFLHFTWDPGGTQSRNVCVCHLTGECWNALATLPTQPEYSTSKIRSRWSETCPRLEGVQRADKTGICVQTEHSSSEVWTQPERSLRTQQAELFSMALFSVIRLYTCLSWRMHGEYLAPKWIRDS